MSVIMDMIGSAVLFGILTLTIIRVQGNLNTTMMENTLNLNTQSYTVALAREIEHDLTKAGYGVTGPKIFVADSTELAFVGALTYGGELDSVAYSIGAVDTLSTNPHDFVFIRSARSRGSLPIRCGMTDFKISYFDSLNAPMATPVAASRLKAIRGINVKFRLESLDAVTDPLTGTTNFFAVSWEKLIYPRNLGKPF
jgi:hypothetical protein